MDTRPEPYRGDKPFVFISYAHSDSDVLDAELRSLHEQAVRVFYDEGILPGDAWRPELETAIEQCALMVFFVSSSSIESRHCVREVHYAGRLDRPIVLVYLEDVELPAGIRLSHGDSQAIRAFELSRADASNQISTAINDLLPQPEPEADLFAYDGGLSSRPQTRRYTNKIALSIGLMLLAILLFQWSQ